METLTDVSELRPYFDKADVIDVKHFEGSTTLRRFIAGMLSYYPWWLVLLYRLREILVRIFGLVRHEAPESLPVLRPEDVSFTPGEGVSFFIVRDGEEERFWISETPPDKHLKAYFIVTREPQDDAFCRFSVITIVFYRHWTGPVYFNLIRPFHHLVVARMARHGLTYAGDNPCHL
jgi:hypothetical protein